jgi:thymidine kinase
MDRSYFELILGNMFAGKTTQLLQRIEVYRRGSRPLMAVVHESDTRYSRDSTELHSHLHHTYPARRMSTLMPLLDDPEFQHAYCVVIDEIQFFPDAHEFMRAHALRLPKLYFVAGLSATYDLKPWPVVSQLIPLADTITTLTARCETCYQQAAFTGRRSCAARDDVVSVGGNDKYFAACRIHHPLFCEYAALVDHNDESGASEASESDAASPASTKRLFGGC